MSAQPERRDDILDAPAALEATLVHAAGPNVSLLIPAFRGWPDVVEYKGKFYRLGAASTKTASYAEAFVYHAEGG